MVCQAVSKTGKSLPSQGPQSDVESRHCSSYHHHGGGGEETLQKGGAVLFQEVMEIMPGEVILKLRKERNGWRSLAPGRKNVPGWSWNNIW